MTTTAPITPLTPAQRRVAQHLVGGLTPRDIAAEAGLSAVTVRQHIRGIRESLHCPPRCALPVLAHFLFTSKEVEPPPADKPVPDLSAEQQMLLKAVAEQSKTYDIAVAARIAPADVRSTLAELLAMTGAADATQLVVLAHAWGLLGADQGTPAPAGAGR